MITDDVDTGFDRGDYIEKNNITYYNVNIGNYAIPSEVKGGVCVDIGANVGCFLEAYHNFFSVVQYYEPQIECFNIIQSKKIDNTFGYNEAVYSQAGLTMDMIAHSNRESGSSALNTEVINKDWDTEFVINKVKTVDLETVLMRVGGRIDYLKIDCETSEYLFLYNKDLSMINVIGLEIHWQMGVSRYNMLIEHIQKSHVIFGDYKYAFDTNKEILCVSKEFLAAIQS